MADRKLLASPKITEGWKIQFPVEVRDYLDKKDKKKFKVGDRVSFYLEPDGRVVVQRG